MAKVMIRKNQNTARKLLERGTFDIVLVAVPRGRPDITHIHWLVSEDLPWDAVAPPAIKNLRGYRLVRVSGVPRPAMATASCHLDPSEALRVLSQDKSV